MFATLKHHVSEAEGISSRINLELVNMLEILMERTAVVKDTLKPILRQIAEKISVVFQTVSWFLFQIC